MLASDCFSIEDTDGDEGTLVAFVLEASGALSRLSEGLDLLLNLLEMLDNKFLLSFTISLCRTNKKFICYRDLDANKTKMDATTVCG